MDVYAAARANPTATITAQSLQQGFLALGNSHQSALDFATYLSPSQHAGASEYRVMDWNDQCGCLAYTGPLLRFASN